MNLSGIHSPLGLFTFLVLVSVTCMIHDILLLPQTAFAQDDDLQAARQRSVEITIDDNNSDIHIKHVLTSSNTPVWLNLIDGQGISDLSIISTESTSREESPTYVHPGGTLDHTLVYRLHYRGVYHTRSYPI